MNMNQMMQFLRQIPGKLGSNMYSAVANQSDPNNVAFVRQLQRDIRKQDVLEKSFSELNLVVFDIETTGFHPRNGDKILSIGAVKMVGEKVLEEEFYYSLIYNEIAPSAIIEELTGITSSDLLEAPPIEKVLTEFFQFVKKDPLVAHHANHERNFMQHVTWSVLKKRFEHRLIDTSFLTKVVDPKTNYLTLDDWCSHYHIEIEKRHHALYDSLATAKLWSQSLKQIQKLGFQNLKEVYSFLATK
jgi:DNA polymerase III subunit epsilon